MAKMGRPAKDIPEHQLRAIMRLNPTQKDVAAFFECSLDTIENKCREYGECTFSEFREQNMVHTRFSLIRNALKMAEAGNPAMSIFCLKNLCNWKDKWDTEISTSKDSDKKLVIEFAEKK